MRRSFENKLIEIIKSVVIECKDEAELCHLVAGMNDEQIDELIKFAEWHQVEHLVSYVLLHSGKNEYINDLFLSISTTTCQAQEAMNISAAMSACRVPHILLKGTVIRRWYPEEWMRNGCDIDILVRSEDLERAKEIMVQMGYAYDGKITHHVAYHKDLVEVEVHYLLIEDFLNQKASDVLDNVWNIALKSNESDEECYLYELPDEYLYFYHLAHMVRHFNRGGCGIRPIIDVWVLNNRVNFDSDKRHLLLTEGGLDKFNEHVVRLSQAWFENAPVGDLEIVEKWIFSGGAFGIGDRVESVQKSKHKNRGKYFLYVMFPPYIKMCHRYPILRKHKWLLPIFYVLRYFHLIYLMGFKRIVHRLKNLFTKDKKQDEITSMLKQMGILDLNRR